MDETLISDTTFGAGFEPLSTRRLPVVNNGRFQEPSKLSPTTTGHFGARAFFDPTERKWRIATCYLAADAPRGATTRCRRGIERADSPPAVDHRPRGDRLYRHGVVFVVDPVDDPVLPSSDRVSPGQVEAKQLAYSRGVVGQVAVDENEAGDS